MIRTLILIVSVSLFGQPLLAQEPVSACQSVESIVASLGMDAKQAKAVSTEFIHQLRNARVAEYFEIPESKPVRYLSTAQILGMTLNLQAPVAMSWSVNELRYLPFMQEGTELMLVVTEPLTLDETQLASVIATARRLGIVIHTVFATQSNFESMQLLSSATGGRVVDLRASACEI